MEVKHTPGPWHVLEGEYRKARGRKFPVVFATGEELKYIAYCDDQLYFYEPTDNPANARLIAAAPELLAALKVARDVLHQHYVDWDGEPEDAVSLQLARAKCDAAIARATDAGEGSR